MGEELLVPFKGMDLYEKSINSLEGSFEFKADKKRTMFVAIYAHEFLDLPGEEFKHRLRARDAVADAQNPILTLVRFKNYWDEKTQLSALKISAPRAIQEIYALEPHPLYLCQLNNSIASEVSRVSHEVKMFWDLRQAYLVAEQAIASNHYNLMRNFGVESNIERMTDYARFLRIWNRDYYIWKTKVTALLEQLAYQEGW
jgi:hypothetical protein